MNLLDKITMPVGVIYNVSTKIGCKMQGVACVEKISKEDKRLASKKA